jgi:membrane-bound lytic murein transglycosylase D
VKNTFVTAHRVSQPCSLEADSFKARCNSRQTRSNTETYCGDFSRHFFFGIRTKVLGYAKRLQIFYRFYSFCFFALFLPLFFSFITPSQLQSEYSSYHRSPQFQIPAKLKARVQFWIDVFTKYDKNHIVVHHRAFPQAVFKVVDLDTERRTMSASQFEAHKAMREEEAKRELRDTFQKIVAGRASNDSLTARVLLEMKKVPGGAEKFSRMLIDEEDLIRVQSGIREKFEEAIYRSGKYIGKMEDIFERHGLPVELTRLPFIESSFNYNALSSVGAAGLWQFMRSTAKGYMTVNSLVDERLDPFVATRAAALYLKDAYERLGSWGLAITSYNHGVGGLKKKMSDIGVYTIEDIIEHPTLRPLGFASNNFFPEFLAAVEVYRNRATYFPGVHSQSELHFIEKEIRRPISIYEIARSLKVSVPLLKEANYALDDSIWSGRSRIPVGYVLRIPTEKSLYAKNDLAVQVSSFHKSTLYHKVRKGETLHQIAKKYNKPPNLLLTLNGLENDNQVKENMELIVSSPLEKEIFLQESRERSSSFAGKFLGEKISEKSFDKRNSISTKTENLIHIVKKGETISFIAGKYRVKESRIKELNHLKNTKLAPGQKLIVISRQVYVNGLQKPKAQKYQKESIKKNQSTFLKKSSTQKKSEERRSIAKVSKKGKASQTPQKKSATIRKTKTPKNSR